MSSYFNLFVKTKPDKDTGESKFLRILSLSSSNDLYRNFWDAGVTSALKYDRETQQIINTESYTKLDDGVFAEVLEDLNKLIESTKNQLSVYYKIGPKKDLEETAMTICREEEYLEELKYQKCQVETIQMIADQAKDSWIDIEGLYGGID